MDTSATARVCLLVAAAATSLAATRTEGAQYKVRTWRIVVNDDGEVPIPGKNRTLAQFLVPKFNDVLGTQVDAYFVCMGSTDRCVPPQRARLQDTMNQWARDGKIPEQLDTQIRTYIAAIRRAKLDLFLSIRMNDIHDAWAKKLSYPLKLKRRDLLIGAERDFNRDTLLSAFWSGFNWAKPEVRQHFHDFIIWCCRKYDFDGVELDWFRHPLMLKPGEEQQNVENLNGFVRQVRSGLNKIAKERGKRYLLTVRTMDTPEQSLRTGLDVEQWLKEGLLDLLMVGGGYMPYGARLRQFIDLAHRYGVPAYPSMNHFKEPEMMRSVASNFFSLSADGFYIFNWYGVADGSEKAKCLKQCGSPEALAGLDKRYVADNGCRIRYCGYANPPSQFPSPLVGGKAIELVVGDDMADAQRNGTLGKMTLMIGVSGLHASPSLTDLLNRVPPKADLCVQINGVQLERGALRLEPGITLKTKLWTNSLGDRTSGNTFVASVTAPPVRRGINHIRVLPGPGSKGSLKVAVEAMALIVDYKPLASTPAAKADAALPGPPPKQLVVKPASGVPLSLYNVPVGSKKTIAFDLTADLKNVKKAQLGLKADDFDSREEVVIEFNGNKPLKIPDGLLADMGFRVGLIDVPLSQLRPGKNVVVFTFASNLKGTTKGFDVAEALLVLQMK